MDSIWSRDAVMPRFPTLDGDVHTDVLIVGGGIAGVLCAYYLQQAGIDYLLVERDSIGSGVTLGTTAKITAQHGLEGDVLLHTLGSDRARLYLQANLQAVEEYRRLCAELDCEFIDADSYIYSRDDRERLDRELAALERLKVPAVFQKDLELPFPVAGAVKFPHQAQFHPLRFLAGLARGLNIREQTFVRALHSHTALTDRGSITAEQIILATHFPFPDRHGGYFLKLYQDRSYMLALRQAPHLSGMYRDADDHGLSFRSAGSYLLLGAAAIVPGNLPWAGVPCGRPPSATGRKPRYRPTGPLRTA